MSAFQVAYDRRLVNGRSIHFRSLII